MKCFSIKRLFYQSCHYTFFKKTKTLMLSLNTPINPHVLVNKTWKENVEHTRN